MSRFVFILLLVMAAFVAVIVGLNSYLLIEDEPTRADAIVAVSGGDTTARTAKAIELYQQGYAPMLVFSGAAKDPASPSNAKVMQQKAVKEGVPATAIKIDELSRDTKENAQGIKTVLSDAEKVILVTSEYHQKRAHSELSNALPDVTVINVPAQDKNWSRYTWWMTPYGWWITLGEAVKNVL